MIDVVIFPVLNNNTANDMLLNSPRKNDVEAQLEFTWKLRKGLGSPVIDVTVKKDSLLVYVLEFFGILAGTRGGVLVRERD